MIRIAAIADLHCGESCPVRFREWFRMVNDEADVFVLPGDLTHFGTAKEAEAVAVELEAVRIPVVAVLGNHDVHSQRIREVKERFREVGVWLLDDGPFTVNVNGRSLGLAGCKGFCGGYGTTCVTPFGETVLKSFIGETVKEADSLERGLRELTTNYRVAVMHYAPIRDTLSGEPIELYPFLGSSLLSEPIDRLGVDLVLHGHAHHGMEVGETEGGIPVRNVALPVLKQYYKVYELGS